MFNESGQDTGEGNGTIALKKIFIACFMNGCDTTKIPTLG